jgi:hydrogenase maturation factor
MFPALLEKKFGKTFSKKAQKLFYKMSVVEDAMTAVKVGVRENGITSMHDATECGIWGGLYEVAQAAGLGVRIVKEDIVVEECVPEICDYFGIDPYASVKALAKKSIKSSVVGELVEAKNGMILVENGKEKKLKHPIVDPFWRAFYDAVGKTTV